MFMTMFTTVCPLSLSWVISIHFTTFHYISDMHFNIILPSTPCFSNWPCSSHPYMPHVPFTLPSLIFHWYSRCRWEDNIEGKQSTYNIILRCFSVNTVAAEQQLVLYIVRVCLQHYLSKTHSTCATLYCYTGSYNTCSHLVNGTKERSYWTQNVCVDFLYNFCLKYFSFWGEFSETLPLTLTRY